MATYSSIRYNFPVAAATTLASVGAGAMTLIKSIDASTDSTISFVDGTSSVVLDNTYKTYVFKCLNIHPNADGPDFTFNMSADTGSNYNVTKTTTFFNAYHDEADSDTSLSYTTANDLAQATGFQPIADGVGGGVADESCSGELWLFNPSDTTFIKHFISIFNTYRTNDYTYNTFSAGYGNTTSAVDAIQFKMSSGNTDTGTFKLYGIA